MFCVVNQIRGQLVGLIAEAFILKYFNTGEICNKCNLETESIFSCTVSYFDFDFFVVFLSSSIRPNV